MSTQPSLFDEMSALQTSGAKTLSLPPKGMWLPADDRLVRLWKEHGVPADLTTVVHAVGMLLALWDEYQQLLAEVCEADQ